MTKKRQEKRSLEPSDYLTKDEIARFLADVMGRARRRRRGSTRAWTNAMIALVLLSSGLRAGELLGLKRRNLPCDHGKNAVFVPADIAKTSIARTVYIPASVAERICEYVRVVRKGARAGSPLFVNERGGAMSYDSLLSKVKIMGKNAGMEWVRPHKFRHTYLTELYNVEYDLRYVQDQAGHTTVKSTQIYTRTATSGRIRQVESLGVCDILAQLPESGSKRVIVH